MSKYDFYSSIGGDRPSDILNSDIDPNISTTSSSSKAVLAALRALQDKIRRLETERTQALDEITQLRIQIKNQEIENEHTKQREILSAQKSLQDTRTNYERLLSEKTELEIKIMALEEKNQQVHMSNQENLSKIKLLEEERHQNQLKVKDLEHQQFHIEQQIKLSQQKEKDMAQSLVWETKQHEEEILTLQSKVERLQQDFSVASHEKASLDSRLVELDSLVAQLLSLNESLVAQLSGRPAKLLQTIPPFLSAASSIKKSKKSKKKSVVPVVPRVANLSTVSLEASKNKSVSTRPSSQLIPVKTNDLEYLKSMHKLYANMAKSLVKNKSPPKKSALKKKTLSPSINRSSLSDSEYLSDHSSSSKKRSTRISTKRPSSANNDPNDRENQNTSYFSQDDHNNYSKFNQSHEVRLPRAGVSFDNSILEKDDKNSFVDVSFDNEHSSNPLTSSTLNNNYYRSTPNASNSNTYLSSSSSNYAKQDLQQVIGKLEDEFDQLNREYRKLLSNVQAQPSTASNLLHPTESTPEGIQSQAEEIVQVIQRLHQKGEQLRVLKSP